MRDEPNSPPGRCDSCIARALAATGGYREDLTPDYRETLERHFGADWKRGQALARDWLQKINAYRRRAAAGAHK